MTVRTTHKPGGQDWYIGTADGDHISGTSKQDVLIGHHGQDIFEFRKGDGADMVVSFESGVDKILIHGSSKQISWHDTAQGIEVDYAHFGRGGPDHFLLGNIHHLDVSDFIWVG